LQNVGSLKDVPFEEKLENVEDIAASLISHLRLRMKTAFKLNYNATLTYYSRLGNKKPIFEGQHSIGTAEHSQKYKIIGK